MTDESQIIESQPTEAQPSTTAEVQPSEQQAAPSVVLYAVYRDFNASPSATADGSGSGSSGYSGGKGVLIGIASSRANAAQLILKDAYDHYTSPESSVYSAVANELKNYSDGVDSVSFSLLASWRVVPIKVDEPLPDLA